MLKKIMQKYYGAFVIALLLPLGCSAQEVGTTAEAEAEATVEVQAPPIQITPPKPTIRYTEGKEYNVLSKRKPPKKDSVQVIEFFWYGCPTCNRFEGDVKRWSGRQPENVKFLQVPGLSERTPVWENHARAYYTAQVLGVEDKTHQQFFDALHVKKRLLNTPAQIRQFFVDAGVSKAQFDNTYNSFAVNTKIRIAKRLAAQYGVSGVPTVVVNGSYTTTPNQAGGYSQATQVMDYLVKQELAKLPKKDEAAE